MTIIGYYNGRIRIRLSNKFYDASNIKILYIKVIQIKYNENENFSI
jgi:hypothetical protein